MPKRKIRSLKLQYSTILYLSSLLVVAVLGGLEFLIVAAYILRPFIFSVNGFPHMFGYLVQLQNTGVGILDLLQLPPLFLFCLLIAWVAAAVGLAVAVKRGHLAESNSDRGMSIQFPQPSSGLIAVSLLIAVILSGFVAYYPYLLTSRLVGVDAPWYYGKLADTENLSQALANFRNEPRALYLLILFVIRGGFGLSSLDAVKVGPVFLATAYTLAVFLASKEFTHNATIGVLAAFLAAASPTVTVGLFAGIYSNWLALFFVVLFFWFVLKSIGERRGILFPLLALLANIAVLLVHPWTWALLFASTLVFAIVAYAARFDGAKRLVFWITFLPAVVVALSIFLFARFGSGGYISVLSAESLLDVKAIDPTFNLRLGYVQYVFVILSLTLGYPIGGFFRNTALLGLAGLLPLVRSFRESRAGWVLAAWLIPISSLAFFADSNLQWRLFYLLPFPIIASIVAGWMIASLVSLRGALGRVLTVVFVLFLILVVLAFGFAIVSQLS